MKAILKSFLIQIVVVANLGMAGVFRDNPVIFWISFYPSAMLVVYLAKYYYENLELNKK